MPSVRVAFATLCLCVALPAPAAEALLAPVRTPHLDDLDGMLARREIRALVAHSRTEYEIVKGQQVGVMYDALVELEKQINQKLLKSRKPTAKKAGGRSRSLPPLKVTIIPVPYDQLYARLEAGLGDMVASPMLVTEAPSKGVQFTAPFYAEAKLVVVTQKGDVLGDGVEALSGRTVVVRASSGMYRALLALNRDLETRRLAPARLVPADEHLSDDELMEMVSAKLIPATVSHRLRARLWSSVFPDLEVNEHNVLADNGELAWAVRTGNPKLKQTLDDFVDKHKLGTLFGNMMRDRYFGSTRHARKALDASGRLRFDEMVGIFERYASRYDFDHLLLMAQGYQESRLDQRARSRAGAVGVMQVLPSTGRMLKVGDVLQVDPNIHAGTKYLDILRKEYFRSPEMTPLDQMYFSFAAYNAGPGNIRRMQSLAARQGLDPNRWFDNVELTTLQRIGREPVDYVSNISKYYVAYRLYTETAGPGKQSAADGLTP